MRLITLISAAVFAASNLPAQQPSAVGLSPIPTLARGAIVPDGSPQFVFLGPTIRQLTISYPMSLDSGGLSGLRRTLQVDLLSAKLEPLGAPPPPGALSMSPVSLLVWRSPSGVSIAPGQSLGEFHIRSSYLPGFTTVYARSDEDYALPADLPAAVKNQLALNAFIQTEGAGSMLLDFVTQASGPLEASIGRAMLLSLQ